MWRSLIHSFPLKWLMVYDHVSPKCLNKVWLKSSNIVWSCEVWPRIIGFIVIFLSKNGAVQGTWMLCAQLCDEFFSEKKQTDQSVITEFFFSDANIIYASQRQQCPCRPPHCLRGQGVTRSLIMTARRGTTCPARCLCPARVDGRVIIGSRRYQALVSQHYIALLLYYLIYSRTLLVRASILHQKSGLSISVAIRRG